MRQSEKVRPGFAAGTTGLAGAVLFGPVGVLVLGALLLLALLGLAGAVVFSDREEPSQRLLELIRAVWRDR